MSLTLNEWLARLERQHPVAIDLGLERVAIVAERLGLGAQALAGRVVTVAGTNGKGSTVALLERLARAHGLTTASYTSPHLIRYNERLAFDGEPAEDSTLIEGFERVEAARLAGEPVSLTYFEAGTLAAMVSIAERHPDIAVLEVGLGGRLDAVNVVDADVAVITTIAHDHADFLGTDLETIGFEKAGILRAGRPAVLGSKELPTSIAERVSALGVPGYWLGDQFDQQSESHGEHWQWRGRAVSGDPQSLDDLPSPGLALDNAAVALQALALCDIELAADAVRVALATVSLPGRLQWRGNWCLDVAHNFHAASHVAMRLPATPRPAHRIGLLGVLKDKDAAAMVQALSPVIDSWIAVGLSGPRARTGEELAAVIRASGASVDAVLESPAAGVAWLAPRLRKDEQVLVCGSFHTVGEALCALIARDETP